MSSSGYMKREALIGKSVVSKNAEIIGTVSDLAVSSDGRVALQVQKKTQSLEDQSEDLFIGQEEIQAMGDVILLRTPSDMVGKPSAVPASSTGTSAPPVSSAPNSLTPPPPPTMYTQSKTCQKCGYVNATNAKFCIKCGATLT